MNRLRSILNRIFRPILRPIRSFLQSFSLGRYLLDLFSNKEVVRRVLFTLMVLALYRVLANIPLPGIDMQVYQSQFGTATTSDVSYFLTVITGGLLETPSIIGLGIGVYITASIIIQLMTSVIPKLEELSKEGLRGRQVIEQYTRYLTLPLSLMYSVGYLYLLSQGDLTGTGTSLELIPLGPDGGVTATKIAFMTICLTAGSMLLMWLAELITERGIGNGASIFITVGILSSLPTLLTQDLASINVGGALQQVLQGNTSYLTDPGMVVLYLIILGFLLVIAGIIWITESPRKLPIQYARRERATGETRESFLPIKLTQSGVLPIIFASSILTMPRLVVPFGVQLTAVGTPLGDFFRSLQTSFLFDSSTVQYSVVYFIFIILFSLFYAFIALKPEEVAENLQKSGGFIPGIRPGKSTEMYITRVLLRLTVVGAIFLAFIALMPILAGNALQTIATRQFILFSAIGGTSILIIVGVVLETIRQLNSLRATQNYERYL